MKNIGDSLAISLRSDKVIDQYSIWGEIEDSDGLVTLEAIIEPWVLDQEEWFPLNVIATSLYASIQKDCCVYDLSDRSIELLEEYVNARNS